MAFPTGSESQTTLASFIPLKWGERINTFFMSKLYMASFFTDRSAELADGGKSLYTPNISEMTATAKSNATAVALNNATETKVTLTVDQWYEASFAIEDLEAAQVKKSYALQKRYAEVAGFAVAKKLEVAIATLFAGFSKSVGASTSAIADSNLRAALGYIAAANIDTNDSSNLAWFFDASVVWNQLMGIDKFTLNINSPEADPVGKGVMGRLYGIAVKASTNIQYVSGTTGRYNALAHKDAIHFATASLGVMSEGGMVGSAGVRVQSNYIPDYLSTITTADIAYGVVENRDEAGVRILTSA